MAIRRAGVGVAAGAGRAVDQRLVGLVGGCPFRDALRTSRGGAYVPMAAASGRPARLLPRRHRLPDRYPDPQWRASGVGPSVGASADRGGALPVRLSRLPWTAAAGVGRDAPRQ